MEPTTLILCPTLGLLVLLLALRGMERRERQLIIGGFVAHVAAAFALVGYHDFVYGGGDIYLYREEGRQLARLIRQDPAFYTPEVLRLAMQMDANIPVELLLGGTSTGTMSAFTGLIMALVGDTLYAASLVISVFSFGGQVSLYRALRPTLTPVERTPALIALLLIPSAVFWSSGVVKEAFAVAFLGFLCSGLLRIGTRKVTSILLGLIAIAIGVIGCSKTKPYVLFPLVLAIGGWYYAKRSIKLNAGYKVLAVLVAIGGLVVASRVFPEFGIDKLSDTVSLHHHNFKMSNASAGSKIFAGDLEDRTAAQQLLYAPLGLFNSLARPFIFEIHNGTMLMAAVEMTAILGFAIRLLRRHSFSAVFGEIRKRPPLLAAAFFAVSFGTAIGLGTTNLGTLSRYRVPMIPMYVGTLLVVGARLKVRKEAKVSKPAVPVARTGPPSLATRAAMLRAQALPSARLQGSSLNLVLARKRRPALKA